jgi:hypothetical protein
MGRQAARQIPRTEISGIYSSVFIPCHIWRNVLDAEGSDKEEITGFMRSFLLKLVIFSAIIFIADFFWNKFVPAYPIPHPEVIILVFFLITAFFHYVITKNKDARPQVIVRYYMSGTVLRLFIYMTILLLYRFIDKPTLIPFAIAFILHYFLFTAFEVMALMKQFKTTNS